MLHYSNNFYKCCGNRCLTSPVDYGKMWMYLCVRYDGGHHLWWWPIRRFVSTTSVAATKTQKSMQSSSNKKSTYTKTLNLPKSDYPMKHSRLLELQFEKRGLTFDTFVQQSLSNTVADDSTTTDSSPLYILHDGPPYANGPAHFGHAINKTLKDIFLKRKLIEGYRIHYRPGWDCHGLPIELKAISDDAIRDGHLHPLQIRERARALAWEQIARQRDTFSQWCLQTTFRSSYYTFDSEYVYNQLKIFHKLWRDGLIYRGLLPVYWSPSTRTALAEAELQYNDHHCSLAAYIRYRLVNATKLLPSSIDPSTHSIYALIWTTTPWTVLANEAIAYGGALKYSLIQLDRDDESLYLVASELIPQLQQILSTTKSTNIRVIRDDIDGKELQSLRYYDPLRSINSNNSNLNDDDRMLLTEPRPLLESDHVTINKGGTGLVHVAPNHGVEDYRLFQRQYRSVAYRKQSIVDNTGRITINDGDKVDIVEDNRASRAVIERLLAPTGSVIHVHEHIHSYPYDWRSGKPVLILPSTQWFLSITDSIREQSKSALDSVRIYPEKLRKELYQQLSSRPNWCISRQRNWGVPIPAFYHTDDHTQQYPIPLDDAAFAAIIDKFRSNGSNGCDIWWQQTPEELLENHHHQVGVDVTQLVKGGDILDIWFDSGCSWSYALRDTPTQIADLYLEGIDQIRGWFQSSLLLSIMCRQVAPFKAIFIHGFALDREGRKMSKSIGNVIDPMDVIDNKIKPGAGGGTASKKDSNDNRKRSSSSSSSISTSNTNNCGLDGVRLWVARYACTHNDVSVDVEQFQVEILAILNRIRNTFRFMLGYFEQFPSSTLTTSNDDHQSSPESLLLPPSKWSTSMTLLDKYIMMRLYEFDQSSTTGYGEYDLNRVMEETIRFLLYDVGTFYFTRVKDRLYCGGGVNGDGDDATHQQSSALTVLWYIYHTMLYHLSPILSHVCMEAHERVPLKLVKRKSSSYSTTNDHDDQRRTGSIISTLAPSVDQFVQSILFDDQSINVDMDSATNFRTQIQTIINVVEQINQLTTTTTSSISTATTMDCNIVVHDDTSWQYLKQFTTSSSLMEQLVEFLQVARVSNIDHQNHHHQVEVGDDHGQEEDSIDESPVVTIQLSPTTMCRCERCRRYNIREDATTTTTTLHQHQQSLCDRCSNVLLRQQQR